MQILFWGCNSKRGSETRKRKGNIKQVIAVGIWRSEP